MHCDGKCYLHKQLAKENKEDDTPADGAKIKIESTTFLLQETTDHFFAFVNHAPPRYNGYIVSLLPGVAKPVFHPPLV
jgi:hypothetical protein